MRFSQPGQPILDCCFREVIARRFRYEEKAQPGRGRIIAFTNEKLACFGDLPQRAQAIGNQVQGRVALVVRTSEGRHPSGFFFHLRVAPRSTYHRPPNGHLHGVEIWRLPRRFAEPFASLRLLASLPLQPPEKKERSRILSLILPSLAQLGELPGTSRELAYLRPRRAGPGILQSQTFEFGEP